jgi:hypothetical protein
METTKYPRVLAKAETTSRRQYDIEKVKVSEPKDTALLTKKGAFTFANAYPYIFDGLAFLCTNHATSQWKDSKGKMRNVIERQDNEGETHYRTIIKVESFMDMALNDHDEYRETFLQQLYHLAAHPEKKVLPFMPGYSILTEPVRIDIVTQDGDKISESEKAQLSNLKNRKDPDKGKIEFIMIEFYKPLFENLFKKNSKGELGQNYIQVPKALNAEIKATVEKLRQTEYFNGTDIDAKNVPLYESDARAVFLYMAQHDNRQGEYITIDAMDFAMSCFPGDVKIIHKEWKDSETGKVKQTDEKYISKADGFKIRSKIKKAIITFKKMGSIGKMDGGQFVPIKLDETNVQYDHPAKEYRIKVLRPKNPAFPTYNPEAIFEIDAKFWKNGPPNKERWLKAKSKEEFWKEFWLNGKSEEQLEKAFWEEQLEEELFEPE